jgi:mannose-6-phosphate isomerase-like protein (cupin superfamily)
MPLQGDIVVGFWILGEGGGEFHTVLSAEPGAELQEGSPVRYDMGFEMEMRVLRHLDAGRLNVLTAMGQAEAGDPVPVVARLDPDFARRPDGSLLFRRVAFHFWNREWPEVIRFGTGESRMVHGANAAVLLYDEQFRSAWFQLKPGMHVNADPTQQVNEFPQLIVVTRGAIRARLDGRELVLTEGEAVFIPPGMKHEFWVGSGEYGECIWIAFGEGA